VALVLGLLLPCIETWRRWGDFARWASWLDDIIAGALLLYAWHAGRVDEQRSRPYLMAAWGYVVGIAYMSFFGQLERLDVADPSGVPVLGVLTFKGVGLILSALCLVFAWRSPASSR
jgi:hypothetical protein